MPLRLPYPNSGELVSIKAAAPGLNTDDLGMDQTMLLTYRDEGRTFANIGFWDQRSATLTERGEATRVPILRVADGTLQTLGVQPLHGRWFMEQESYGPPAAGLQSVILSYAFWQRRFGGDETVIGREITMEAPSNAVSNPFAGQWQVVGIMPQGFRFLDVTPQASVQLISSMGNKDDWLITNTSSSVIDTHLLVIVTGLQAGVTVDAKEASTTGKPYYRMFLPDGVLNPGQSFSTTVVRAGGGSSNSYTFQLMSGQGKP